MVIAHLIEDYKLFEWNVKKSATFEMGLIDGYHDNNVSESFFQVLSLYAAESYVGHIRKTITFGDEEVKISIEVADRVYECYKGISETISTRYNDKLKDKYKA